MLIAKKKINAILKATCDLTQKYLSQIHINSTYIKFLEGLYVLVTTFCVKFGIGIKIAFVYGRNWSEFQHQASPAASSVNVCT